MGYESHWTGQVRIEPALTWAEIKNDRSKGFQDLKLLLDEQTEDTPTGQTRTVTASLIGPLTGGAYNGYDVEAELQSVIDAHPTHEFTGATEARPLDPGGTPWRYVIQGRTVVRQEPRIVWPGEDEARLEQARRIAVALEQQLALATVMEVPRPGTGIPLQLRRSYGHADRWAICDRTGRRWHREHGWVYEPDGIRDEHLRDDTRYTLADALPLAQQLAEDGAA